MLQDSEIWMKVITSWRTWAITYVIIIVAYTLASLLIFTQVAMTAEQVRAEITQLAPLLQAPLPDFSRVIFYFPPTTEYSLYAAIFIVGGFVLAEVLSLLSVYALLRKLQEKKASFSEMTYKLHRQLTIALGLQLATPLIFIICPVVFWVFYNIPYGRMEYVTARSFLLHIQLYGTVNSIITLYFIKPYRRWIISKFKVLISFVTFGKYGHKCDIVAIHQESTFASGTNVN
uniref:G protein-coupled receptor n=1 Tax=Bursaphelenchus xylophilus TaxID=6326 RepID=A0A1I7RZG2_BURXY